MLYIIRHGKTDWNAIRKLQGRTDIPLNDEGRKMAEQAAIEYKDVHFDVCYASPLIRAKETAEIVLKGRNVPIFYDDRLMEMSYGEYEGIEIGKQPLDAPVNILFRNPEQYKSPTSGESFEQLFARTGEFLKEVIDPLLKQGKDVLIAGHGAMNCSIICQKQNIPLEQFWSAGIENCKLKEIKVKKD